MFLMMYAMGVLGSAMSSQASAARVLYAMGRDGQLPNKFFGKLNKRYQTPTNNIILISFLSLSSLFLSLTLVASFINFGAFFHIALSKYIYFPIFWTSKKAFVKRDDPIY